MRLKNERIACPALAITLGSLTVYDIFSPTTLPMDRVNWYIKNHKHVRIEYAEKFVTTHGRVLDEDEAFAIALNAHQIVSDKMKAPLTSLDIWPR